MVVGGVFFDEKRKGEKRCQLYTNWLVAVARVFCRSNVSCKELGGVLLKKSALHTSQ